MHLIRTLILAVAVLSACALNAEDTRTGIFDDSFRTLTVTVDNDRLAPPVLALGTDDRLVIGFDQLSDDREYLRYTIVHCDADWQPSALVDSEVFDGFNFAEVDDYAMSHGTAVHYVHYTITLPNDNYQFRISGNYLLKVYPEDDPEKTILQVRFMVTENAVGVGGAATSRTDIDYNGAHQQLEIMVDPRNCQIRDPFNDLRVVVQQNYRPDTERVLTHPTRTQGGRLVYEHQRDLIFPAGNEYRRMETVTALYPGMGVEAIDYVAPYYHHYLATDKPRTNSAYRYDQTQHGRYFVREYNSQNSDVEADYTLVHFTLETPQQSSPVYLEGDFTARRYDDNSLMRYDPSTGLYGRIMLLKQGAYNYQYVTPDAPASVEGNKYETVNEYPVAVYYRAPGERYDRLLGYTIIFSGR